MQYIAVIEGHHNYMKSVLSKYSQLGGGQRVQYIAVVEGHHNYIKSVLSE